MDMTELADKLSRSVQGTEALDNRRRAIRAYEALVTFAGPEIEEPVEDLLTDLLCNLLHLTDLGIPFAEPWQRAVRHHYAETSELRDHLFQEALTKSRDEGDPSYRCPECDTYSGKFTPGFWAPGEATLTHSICGREGLVASFIRGTDEYEEAYGED